MLDRKSATTASRSIASYGKGDIALNILTANDYYPCDIEFRVRKCVDLSLRERVERLMDGITNTWVLTYETWTDGLNHNVLYIPDKEAAVNTLGKMFRIPHLWDIVRWIKKDGACYNMLILLCSDKPSLEGCPFLKGRKLSPKEGQYIHDAFIMAYGEY